MRRASKVQVYPPPSQHVALEFEDQILTVAPFLAPALSREGSRYILFFVLVLSRSSWYCHLRVVSTAVGKTETGTCSKTKNVY